jgi:hypothetical protein
VVLIPASLSRALAGKSFPNSAIFLRDTSFKKALQFPTEPNSCRLNYSPDSFGENYGLAEIVSHSSVLFLEEKFKILSIYRMGEVNVKNKLRDQ